MLLDFCLLKQNHIITVDRDEKIKISRFPQTYVVEHFFLGHSSFVSTICSMDDEIIATTGGDSKVIFWNICQGNQVCTSSKIHDGPIKKLICLTSASSSYVDHHILFALPGGSAQLVGQISCEENISDISLHNNIIFAVGKTRFHYTKEYMSSRFKAANTDYIHLSEFLAKCVPRPLNDLYKSRIENQLDERMNKRVKVT